MRCGIFGGSRTVRSSHASEKFFVKVPGKISGEIVLGKIQKIFFVCEKFFRKILSRKIHARNSNFLNKQNQNPTFNPV